MDIEKNNDRIFEFLREHWEHLFKIKIPKDKPSGVLYKKLPTEQIEYAFGKLTEINYYGKAHKVVTKALYPEASDEDKTLLTRTIARINWILYRTGHKDKYNMPFYIQAVFYRRERGKASPSGFNFDCKNKVDLDRELIIYFEEANKAKKEVLSHTIPSEVLKRCNSCVIEEKDLLIELHRVSEKIRQEIIIFNEPSQRQEENQQTNIDKIDDEESVAVLDGLTYCQVGEICTDSPNYPIKTKQEAETYKKALQNFVFAYLFFDCIGVDHDVLHPSEETAARYERARILLEKYEIKKIQKINGYFTT